MRIPLDGYAAAVTPCIVMLYLVKVFNLDIMGVIEQTIQSIVNKNS